MPYFSQQVLHNIMQSVLESPYPLCENMGFEDFKLEKIGGKHVAVSKTDLQTPVTFTIIGRLLAKVANKGLMLGPPEWNTGDPVARRVALMYDQQIIALAEAIWSVHETPFGDKDFALNALVCATVTMAIKAADRAPLMVYELVADECEAISVTF
ncbi:hypothetical protein B0H13DRAFT_1855565 [Mycena leptocephala]|nr:hypothetical protein B0H13DRAFT_1855565 [Mycena leptocephala]